MPEAGINSEYIYIHMEEKTIKSYEKERHTSFFLNGKLSTSTALNVAMWLHCKRKDVWAESGVLFDTSILLDTGIRNQLSIFSRLSIGVCWPLII